MRVELLSLADGVIQNNASNFDYTIMLGQDRDHINLTVKTYNVKKGLATRLHTTAQGAKISSTVVDEQTALFDPNEVYYIKGPMG